MASVFHMTAQKGLTTIKMEANKTKGETAKVHCHRCNCETRHLVRQSVDQQGSELLEQEHCTISWTDYYQIIQCQGCETLSFRHLNWFSEYQDPSCDGTRKNSIRARLGMLLRTFSMFRR